MTGNFAFASRGANIAFLKGIVVIASAGNSGASANPHIGVPAEATHVLSVGAVKADATYATFSSIGPSFDGRVKPDIMAQGQAARVANINGEIVTASGTSFSAPIMAGMIASFWSAVPSLTAAQVVQFVKQSADRFSAPTNLYGFGIPDFLLALTQAQQMDHLENEGYAIYPNPMDQEMKVDLTAQFTNVRLNLFNNLGQKVIDRMLTSDFQTLNVAHLSPGIYFYTLDTNNKSFQGKLVKQ